MWKVSLFLLALTASQVLADVYMHNPRGSNNRLNEANAERNNGNRLFDSQNNNRGGYNVGDRSTTAATDATNANSPMNTFNAETTTTQQYQMVYYEGSILQIEWTAQHGCGGSEGADPQIQNCNMVIQYACDIDSPTDPSLTVALRDGTTTNQVNEDGTDNTRGYHESARWYTECKNRQRNTGLFLADQNLQGNTAIYTRQNPNNNRRGLECPEERDYYPYWLPTIWRDVAYLTDRVDLCPWILENSQNTADKFKCYDPNSSGTIISKTTRDSCFDAGGQYLSFSHGIAAPVCQQAQWSRNNHLGNTRDGQMANYNWTLPAFSDLVASKVKVYDNDYAKCVVRLRYNISTDDYDPWNTNATSNGNASPVRDNPTVDIGSDLNALKIALNTDQTGRTFQDRSHIFYIRRRPASLPLATKVINLNVRGKRGNIVQTYPGVEYDFVPNRLHVTTSDAIHLQWTGSNTHNNNPNAENAGDGQGGDAGEGTGGTDRSNFVQLVSLSDNFPVALDKVSNNFFAQFKCFRLDGSAIGSNDGTTNVDCAVWLATSGYFRTGAAVRGATGGNDDLNPTLNNAPPSLIGGVILRPTQAGAFHYACTRNNSFSNRSQRVPSSLPKRSDRHFLFFSSFFLLMLVHTSRGKKKCD